MMCQELSGLVRILPGVVTVWGLRSIPVGHRLGLGVRCGGAETIDKLVCPQTPLQRWILHVLGCIRDVSRCIIHADLHDIHISINLKWLPHYWSGFLQY